MLETSTGGSDTDTLRLQAGTIVDFLDWALPETPRAAPFNGTFRVSDSGVAPFSLVLFMFVEEAQHQPSTESQLSEGSFPYRPQQIHYQILVR